MQFEPGSVDTKTLQFTIRNCSPSRKGSFDQLVIYMYKKTDTCGLSHSSLRSIVRIILVGSTVTTARQKLLSSTVPTVYSGLC
jgi:hypothetical protein